jgi:hypothetical protein
MREWASPSDAWQRGFRDGYLGIHDTPVEQFHSAYEIGQLSGMAERKALTASVRTSTIHPVDKLANSKLEN